MIGRRVRPALFGLLGLFGLAGAAEARMTTPAAAPRAWVAYAEGATAAITGWLNGAELPAPTLRTALLRDANGVDASVARVELSVWVDRGGRLSRIAHAPFAAPEAARDLEVLLIGKPIGVPPRRMRQPMRLAITVEPAPLAATAGGSL